MKADIPDSSRISKDLGGGLQFLSQIKTKITSRWDCRQRVAFGLLLALLIASFTARSESFWLPHWQGDQSQYIGLAMKLKAFGLDGYSLRRIDLRFITYDKDPYIKLVYPVVGPEGEDGDMIRVLKSIGLSYYDEPLHYRAPLFSYILLFSHKLFTAKDQPFIVPLSDYPKGFPKKAVGLIKVSQYWAAIVPIMFHLGTVVVIYLLGAHLFSSRWIGLVGAFLMTFNATSIFLTHLILSDEVAVFFLSFSLYLFMVYRVKQNLWGVALAGAVGGLAILTRQQTGLVLLIVGIYTLFIGKSEMGAPQKWLFRFLNPSVIVFVFALLAVSGFWFIRVWSMYGHPLYSPGMGISDAMDTDISGWFQALEKRPHAFFIFTFGVFLIIPLFGLAYATCLKLNDYLRRVDSDSHSRSFCFLWLWILVFFFYLTRPWNVVEGITGKEHRYFYYAYPALSILTAYALSKIRLRINQRISWRYSGEALVSVLLLLNGGWSVYVGMKKVLSGNLLF